MRYRIDGKRLAVFTVLGILIVLLLRGCLYACSTDVQEDSDPNTQWYQEAVLRVYNDETQDVMKLSLEQYLTGVVAAEMPASFELEALKAQAVAARTFTVRCISDPCSQDYQICTDSACCQAWCSDEDQRENWGAAYADKKEKVRLAVAGTAGQILTYQGEPIEALYHSTSGGYTEDSEHVFSASLPYLRSVESPGEEAASHYLVETNLSDAKLARLLREAFPKCNVTEKNAEKRIRILSRYQSGRVERVQVGDAEVTGREFRKALSLDSANFSFDFSGDGVVIVTRGYGHGVGMSQYGANAMAKDGASYQDILLHYYTGVSIEPWKGGIGEK